MHALFPRRLAEFVFAALLALVVLPPVAAADDAVLERQDYQLDVSINGQPTKLVARFTQSGDGRFASPASELRELGLKVADGVPDGDLIPLDAISGLSYVYDEQKQAIAIEVGDDQRVTKTYDARGEQDGAKIATADYGAVLNYAAFGALGGEDDLSNFNGGSFSGINASLDGRLFTPYGVLNQSAIAGMTLAQETSGLRLETTYTFTDQDNLVTWRGGDVISGGVGWSRPVRLGGMQAQRTFSIRPDLVTTPLPAVSGSAAVPSTVDVFVNGVKSHSQQVGAGPYQIDNIPSISGSGVAQVITRDAAGRESVQSLSFYTSPRLLRPGLYDFSVEGGYARRGFGVENFDYGVPAASATLRSGITDWLTAESHAEGSDDLINFGAGFAVRAFDASVVGAAVSASLSDQGTGTQVYGSFETKIGAVTINARAQHAIGDYDDLASLTARADNGRLSARTAGFSGIGRNVFSLEPPRAIDQITISAPLSFDKSTISATFLRYEPESGERSDFVTATYSRPLIANANMYATGFTDLNDSEQTGVYVGVSMPLDDGISVNAAVASRQNEYSGNLDVGKPVGPEAGSWGWRIRDFEGANSYRTAAVGHRTSAARVEASLRQDENGVRGAGEIEGAIAMLGGNVYMTNRIDDGFAVVDAHAPGVRVQRENVVAGVTNDEGKILIPNLNAYQKNKIAIDPMDLPLNAEIASTLDYVTPGYKSGVYVNFDVKQARPSAIVILTDPAGAFVPAGAEGRLAGSDEPFIVGYDGQAFVKGIGAVNTIHVSYDGRDCTAQFAFAPTDNIQPTIGPEVCQ
jgi:outer membrane usher protein